MPEKQQFSKHIAPNTTGSILTLRIKLVLICPVVLQVKNLKCKGRSSDLSLCRAFPVLPSGKECDSLRFRIRNGTYSNRYCYGFTPYFLFTSLTASGRRGTICKCKIIYNFWNCKQTVYFFWNLTIFALWKKIAKILWQTIQYLFASMAWSSNTKR